MVEKDRSCNINQKNTVVAMLIIDKKTDFRAKKLPETEKHIF